MNLKYDLLGMEIKNLILIVDDDVRNIFALELTLKAKGYKVISCQGAREALQIIEQNKQLGLVLMDMMMPDMDGYEAISIVRNSTKYPQVPIIAVTAQAMSGDREKCIASGANDYISKPIQVDLLLDVIKKWM